MEITKIVSIIIGSASLLLSLLNYFGIKPENVPDYLQPFFLIPWYWYVIILLVCAIFYLARKEKPSGGHIAAFYRGPLQKVGEVEYKGVKWDVRAPQPQTFENPDEYEKRLPDIAEVNIPPRCPNCGVDLEEKKSLILGHIWKCVDCGFSKRNFDSYYTEYKRAEKIWIGRCRSGTLTKKE